MRKRLRLIHGLAGAFLIAVAAGPAVAATNTDPDWPCIQRKVPELSLAQIWNGPELPGSVRDWSNDPEIAGLVQELAARRVPVEEAQERIRTFAELVPANETEARLATLVQGLFDHMNAERSQVISGIGRYARKQAELADRLRKERSALEAFRSNPDADADEIAKRADRLTWDMRIFQERAQSLTFVCEVPTLIEQRLYQLAKAVAEMMKED
jgi:prefoldin subunit 5